MTIERRKKKSIKLAKIIILAAAVAGFFYIQAVFAQEKININTAGVEELDTLPGIGPSKARAIINYREENGDFQIIEEITNVSGIGSATFENIKDSITVDNLPGEESGVEQEDELPINKEEEAKFPIGNLVAIGDVVINEFVSDPADGEEEWVELYNTANRMIDLSGWTIEEGSGAKTYLDGKIGLSGASGFFVVEKPKGYLNNKGDIIILRDSLGNLIDSAAYGNWEDGDVNNNAPAAGDPYSTARKIDGQDSASDADDFALTVSLTKGESNVIIEDLDNKEVGGGKVGNGDIIISEILPNPFGIDADGEFIELHNSGEEQIDLFGWRLNSGNSAEFEFKEERIIAVNEYLAIYRSESRLVLSNKGGSVKLFKPGNANALQTVKFKKADEGWSYNAKETKSPIGDLVSCGASCEYVWSEVATPGKENIIPEINNPPLAVFYYPDKILPGVPVVFDASDTVDEDGDELSFAWDFGDGFKNNLQNPEHTFFVAGDYTVKLIVGDGESETVISKKLKVESEKLEIKNEDFKINKNEGIGKIIINEILPDPEGSDSEGEWIELYNQGSGRVSLLDWRLDDGEAGSRPYVITNSANNIVNPGEYFVIDRAESGIALNNINDSARLFNDLDELIDEVEYDAVIGGESYARGKNGKWFWTAVLTPGEENIISVADSMELGIRGLEPGVKVLGASGSFTEPVAAVLGEISGFESGDLVIVSGVVAVLPGILGSQYFYIVSGGQVSAAGLQIYNYKKDFPELKVGNYIEVAGELSSINGEQRLKIKNSGDIKIIDYRAEPAAEEIAADEINEDYIGRLVEITGEIVERKSSVIYLDDDTGEAVIYIKKYTGINARDFEEGEIITVTGIVGGAKSGARIMPRRADDISRRGEAPPRLEGGVQSLDEPAQSDEWAVEARDKKSELFKYLLIIAGGIIVVLGGLLAKAIKVIDE